LVDSVVDATGAATVVACATSGGWRGWHRPDTLQDVYEPPAPARRIGPLLIVVLLVLAGVGATMGYLVASRILDNQAALTPPAGTQKPGGSTATPARTTAAAPLISKNPNDAGTFCPAVTSRALTDAGLNGELTLLLYIEVTIPRGKARAWICRNAEGTLYYQAHELAGPFDRANNAQNTILLGTGIKGDVAVLGEGFKATNPKSGGPDTIYTISRTLFTIEPGATRATPTRSIPA
jgi:hypothetical protein